MTTPDDKEHDKLLCERLAKTVDHGICKCAERHRIAELETELAAERERRAEARAKIDALMLEYCPDEMTPGQVDEWARHQRPIDAERDALRAALAAERELAEAREGLQAGRDLMAVVHGDGGHYREQYGDRKASEDAITIVSALRAALDDERGLRAALFKYARIILFDPRNPLAYPLEHNPHAIGSKNAQADIERCLRAAIAGAAKVDKTEASK